MINHSQKAGELFDSGYNCSQAVFGAFCEELGLDLETGMKLASPFGGGMAGMHEVCGAVTALFALEGLFEGNTVPGATEVKAAQYEKLRGLAERFKVEKKSIICGELIASADPLSPEKRHNLCRSYVRCAAKLAEELMA